jgi:CHAD domain-containing protein
MAGFWTDLVRRHQELRDRLLDGVTLARLRQSLAAVEARIDTWPIETLGWDSLGTGLKRVYRRGRKAMAAAYDDPRAERFHEWRKRAKYLRHQLEFLEELWPEVLRGSAESAHALTDVLGDAQDLAVLGRAVDTANADPTGDAEPFCAFVASRRELLWVRAEPMGLRLYAETPSRFVDRLGRYWKAGVPPGAAA